VKRIIAIDPGLSGGIAYTDANGSVCCAAMPPTQGDVRDLVEQLATGETIAVLEQQNGFVAQAGPGHMFTFGEGYGFIQGVLAALRVRLELVRPQEWQKALGMGSKKNYPGRLWKNHLKEEAQRLFPTLDITLKTADALLLLEYARRKE
jgi:hypothetical protein